MNSDIFLTKDTRTSKNEELESTISYLRCAEVSPVDFEAFDPLWVPENIVIEGVDRGNFAEGIRPNFLFALERISAFDHESFLALALTVITGFSILIIALPTGIWLITDLAGLSARRKASYTHVSDRNYVSRGRWRDL